MRAALLVLVDPLRDCLVFYNPVSCGQAVPPAVGDTLHVEPSGASDVQVTWNGVGGASNYNVWRSADALQQTAAQVGTTGAPR